MKALLITLSLIVAVTTGCKDKNEPILTGLTNVREKCTLQIDPLKNFVVNKKFTDKFLVSAVEQTEKLPAPNNDLSKLFKRFEKADFTKKVAADMVTGITQSKCDRSKLHQIFSKLLESARNDEALKARLTKAFKVQFLETTPSLVDVMLAISIITKLDLTKDMESLAKIKESRAELQKFAKKMNNTLPWGKLDNKEKLSADDIKLFKETFLEEFRVSKLHLDKIKKLVK